MTGRERALPGVLPLSETLTGSLPDPAAVHFAVDIDFDSYGVARPPLHENRAAHVDVPEAQPGEPPDLHALGNDSYDL